MLLGVVPRLQAHVVSTPFVANSPRLKGLLEHPAGPFTSEELLPRSVGPGRQKYPGPRSVGPRTHSRTAPPHPHTTVHFWAPTAKWMISIANVADLQRPVEKVSVPQQTGGCAPTRHVFATVCVSSLAHPTSPPRPSPPPPAAAVTATGVIWSRYATQITPVNYNLLAVNVLMCECRENGGGTHPTPLTRGELTSATPHSQVHPPLPTHLVQPSLASGTSRG